jgi:hypothetical protein
VKARSISCTIGSAPNASSVVPREIEGAQFDRAEPDLLESAKRPCVQLPHGRAVDLLVKDWKPRARNGVEFATNRSRVSDWRYMKSACRQASSAVRTARRRFVHKPIEIRQIFKRRRHASASFDPRRVVISNKWSLTAAMRIVVPMVASNATQEGPAARVHASASCTSLLEQ